MKYLILLLIVLLCSCGEPDEHELNKYEQKNEEQVYKLVSETTEWRVYKINDSCFLAVPRYNDDNPPVILKTRE